jgi:hypothetical protein
VALAGLAGLGVAAVTLGATDSATPLQPAADTVETQTQVVSTVEHRTKRLEAQTRADGRRVVRATQAHTAAPLAQTTSTSTPTTPPVPQSDDGPGHDVGDDNGGRGAEAADDNGGREVEAGDDHRGGSEAGDDHGGGSNSGPGGGSQDD